LMDELRRILHASGTPAIYVTHDQEEAFTLADRVLLLHAGLIIRSGTPEQVWSDPGSVWTAQFLDAGNVVAGTVISTHPRCSVETAFGIFELEDEVVPVPARDEAVLVPARDEVVLVPARDEVVPVPGHGCHKYSRGEKVNILINRRNVQRGGEGSISGVVTDVVFRQDGFKVTLANGLDFYLPDAPRVGENINLVIPKAGIRWLS
jgi:ABC-type Fe3+/spermidine/putrescine transport system ATPase subunit